MVGSIGLSLVIVACDGGEVEDGAGTGGTSGASGGKAGTGGTGGGSGTGGSAGAAAGSAGTGGAAGKAGAAGKGGSAGAAGKAGAAGAAGKAGAAGAAGKAGAAGAAGKAGAAGAAGKAGAAGAAGKAGAAGAAGKAGAAGAAGVAGAAGTAGTAGAGGTAVGGAGGAAGSEAGGAAGAAGSEAGGSGGAGGSINITCGSLELAGTTSARAQAPTNAAYDISGQFTLEGWVFPKERSLGLASTILALWEAPTAGNAFLVILPDGRASVAVGGAYYDDPAAAPVPLNAWSHIAATYDGTSTLRVFVNGASVYSVSLDRTGATASGAPLVIGGLQLGNSWDFIGSIDSVRLSNTARYTAAFTPAALTNDANAIALYQLNELVGLTGAKDSSATANDAVLSGGAAFAPLTCAP